MITAGPRSI